MAPPSRALRAKFYAKGEGEIQKVDLWLRVMAGTASTRLTLTALVGKRSNAQIPQFSAYGYKPKLDGTRSKSGAG